MTLEIMSKRILAILCCWLIAVHAPAATITGSSISLGDPGPIGATTPSSGAFTTLSATGPISTSTGLVSAPAIGNSSTGLYFGGGGGDMYFTRGGAYQGAVSSSGIQIKLAGTLGWEGGGAGSAPDTILLRDAAAAVQLGSDHATVATAQKIKAHDVTTGTGAALTLAGGNGSVAGGVVKIDVSPTTTPATSGQFDATVTAGQTRFLLYDVDNATLERVTVGAADSAGAGFKVLRIPN